MRPRSCCQLGNATGASLCHQKEGPMIGDQRGQEPPGGVCRCPVCGSLRVLAPSSFDRAGRWCCLDCGQRWTPGPVPDARGSR